MKTWRRTLWTTLLTAGLALGCGESNDNKSDETASNNQNAATTNNNNGNNATPNASSPAPDASMATPDTGTPTPDMGTPTPDTSVGPDEGTTPDPQGVHAYTVQYIDGFEADLSEYAGKVLLIVNVASKCGFTPQYETLEQLYQARKAEGLEILAFPANNFNMQEPGSNEEIAEFCDEEYGITFPLFAKISVKGADQHPLYAYLTGEHGEVQWNFNKFLVGKDGLAVARYGSTVDPLSEELGDAITTELAR